MRYKVGDKVVVRKDLIGGQRYHYENSTERLYFNKVMCKLCGKVCVVARITNPVLDEYFLSIDGEEVEWYFNNAMLMPVKGLKHLISLREVI